MNFKVGDIVIITNDESPFFAHNGKVSQVTNDFIFVSIPGYGVRHFPKEVECLRLKEGSYV